MLDEALSSGARVYVNGEIVGTMMIQRHWFLICAGSDVQEA